MTVKNSARVPSENDEARALHQWLKLNGYPHTHIMNESGAGVRNMKRTQLGKAMGVSPGYPDYMIYTPAGVAPIELKRQKGGVVSDYQEQWLRTLSKAPYHYPAVCRGAEAAINYINALVSHRPDSIDDMVRVISKAPGVTAYYNGRELRSRRGGGVEFRCYNDAGWVEYRGRNDLL